MVVRRVAAILALDVVGYSRRMSDDELTTLQLLGDLKEGVLYPAFARWNGRVFKEMGDGILAEFASVVDAVECANEIQSEAENAVNPASAVPLRMRIGIHFGEVVAEGDDLFGDTVNIAARIESIAEVGGVWLSEQAHRMIGNRVALDFEPKRARRLKNIPEPVPLFALVPGDSKEGTGVGPNVAKPQGRKLGLRRASLLGGLAAIVLAMAAYGYFQRTQLRTVIAADRSLPGDLSHGKTFSDCDSCPTMVAVAGGSLAMGAPAVGIASGAFAPDQGPLHGVTVAPFAIGRHEVTRKQFRAFLSATDHRSPRGCSTWEDGARSTRDDRSFANAGYPQEDDHPAVCVSWRDAQAYVDWLSRTTGKAYRLPSEAEWEFVARAGTDMRFSFGDDPNAICRHDNIGDATARSRWPNWETAECSDGRIFTAPVASYAANPLGVFDIYGNVREWVKDCWHNTYSGAPTSSAAWETDECDERVVRGGSWDSKPSLVSSSWRGKLPADHRDFLYGFRVARDLQ